MTQRSESRDAEFDLRARVELGFACDPGEPPAHLFRETTPWLAAAAC